MQFWRFIDNYDHLGSQLPEAYNPILVAVSVSIACLAAYVALAVVDRILVAKNPSTKRMWLLTGAFAMGVGTWAMHFIAMLAFALPVDVVYSVPITLASVVPVILGSGVALHVMGRTSLNWSQLQCGGLLMAGGIGAMHYTGMEAMRMDAYMYYEYRIISFKKLIIRYS